MLSLPIGMVFSPVKLVEISTTEAAYVLHFRRRMLRPTEAVDWEAYQAQKVYQDPVFRTKRTRLQLAARLRHAGVLEAVGQCDETVGLFGVIKG